MTSTMSAFKNETPKISAKLPGESDFSSREVKIPREVPALAIAFEIDRHVISPASTK